MAPSASRSRPWIAASAGALLAGCPACVEPRSEVVVVVDSDLAVGDELDAFQLTVTGPDGRVERDQPVELGEGTGRYELPVSFGIAPRGGDPERVVRVDLTAYDEDDALPEGRQELFSTHRVTTFVAEEKRRLDIFLARACLELTCPAAEACDRDGCVAEAVDPAALPRWDG